MAYGAVLLGRGVREERENFAVNECQMHLKFHNEAVKSKRRFIIMSDFQEFVTHVKVSSIMILNGRNFIIS
jgi:hypothetical protein